MAAILYNHGPDVPIKPRLLHPEPTPMSVLHPRPEPEVNPDEVEAEATRKQPVSPSVGRFVKSTVFALDPNYDAGALALSAEQQTADRKKWATEAIVRRFVPIGGTRSKAVVQIACGLYHTLLATETCELMAIGSGDYGQLGLGDRKARDVPCTIREFSGRPVLRLAAGLRFSVVALSTGELFSFGTGDRGELGHGHEVKRALRPRRVEALRDERVCDVSAGLSHVLAASNEGRRIFSWGSSANGQLGIGTREPRSTPAECTLLRSNEPLRQLAAGYQHSAVITATGDLWTWGRGRHGQLGYRCPQDQLRPRLVTELGQDAWAVQVTAGGRHTVVLLERGDTLVFGMRGHSAGSHATLSRPVRREERGEDVEWDSVVQIAAGGSTAAVLTLGGLVSMVDCGSRLEEPMEGESRSECSGGGALRHAHRAPRSPTRSSAPPTVSPHRRHARPRGRHSPHATSPKRRGADSSSPRRRRRAHGGGGGRKGALLSPPEPSEEIGVLSNAPVGVCLRVEDTAHEAASFDSFMPECIKRVALGNPVGFGEELASVRAEEEAAFASRIVATETAPIVDAGWGERFKRAQDNAELAISLADAVKGWLGAKGLETSPDGQITVVEAQGLAGGAGGAGAAARGGGVAEEQRRSSVWMLVGGGKDKDAPIVGNAILGDVVYDAGVLGDSLVAANKTLETLHIFHEIDKDGSGEIDNFEMKRALAKLGQNVGMAEVMKVIAEYDTDGNGEISEEEFLEYSLNRPPTRNPLMRLLNRFRASRPRVTPNGFRVFIDNFKEECVKAGIFQTMPPELKSKLCIARKQPNIFKGELDLRGTKMTDPFAAALATAIKAAPVIRKVDVRRNFVTTVGAVALTDAVRWHQRVAQMRYAQICLACEGTIEFRHPRSEKTSSCHCAPRSRGGTLYLLPCYFLEEVAMADEITDAMRLRQAKTDFVRMRVIRLAAAWLGWRSLSHTHERARRTGEDCERRLGDGEDGAPEPLSLDEFREIFEDLLDDSVDKFKADCTGHMSEATKRKEVARIFDGIDVDGSGEIDAKEMRVALKRMGIRVSLKKTNEIVQEFDTDGGGTISLDEFTEFVMDEFANKGKLGATGNAGHSGLGIGRAFGEAAKAGSQERLVSELRKHGEEHYAVARERYRVTAHAQSWRLVTRLSNEMYRRVSTFFHTRAPLRLDALRGGIEDSHAKALGDYSENVWTPTEKVQGRCLAALERHRRKLLRYYEELNRQIHVAHVAVGERHAALLTQSGVVWVRGFHDGGAAPPGELWARQVLAGVSSIDVQREAVEVKARTAAPSNRLSVWIPKSNPLPGAPASGSPLTG